jgi:ATP-binding cassette subfamily C (CFTR/MRP) protein 4
MINAIVRSPGSFFDITPSGLLTNKFSNDLGIIDNVLIMAMIDAFEGPINLLSAIINICQIDVFILIPAGVVLFFSLALFLYSRPVIIGTKQLDLQNKSPIFHFFS